MIHSQLPPHVVLGLGSDKSHQRNTSWQLFHLDDQLAALRRDEGCPCSIPETSIPWLFQMIQTYQDHHLHLSNQDRIASMTTSLPPFILSTSIPSPQTEVDPSLDQYIHLLDLSNSLYTSLSSRNLNVFLIWNESGYVYSPRPQPPSSLENPTESLSSTKDKIIEIFQTIPELKLLFLEFLEINLHLHLYQN